MLYVTDEKGSNEQPADNTDILKKKNQDEL